MKVLLAENAGFCFGVKRAVDEAIKTQKQFNKTGTQELYCSTTVTFAKLMSVVE